MGGEYNPAFHWRVFNVSARIFGLLAIANGVGFGVWAARFALHPDLPHGATISESVVLDHAVLGALSLVMGYAFVTVRPYRPDLKNPCRQSWWTGEPR